MPKYLTLMVEKKKVMSTPIIKNENKGNEHFNSAISLVNL